MEAALANCFGNWLGIQNPYSELPEQLEDRSVLRYQDYVSNEGTLSMGIYQSPRGVWKLHRIGTYKDLRLTGEDIVCETLSEVLCKLLETSYFDCWTAVTMYWRIEELLGPQPLHRGFPRTEDILHVLFTISTSEELMNRVANLKWGIS